MPAIPIMAMNGSERRNKPGARRCLKFEVYQTIWRGHSRWKKSEAHRLMLTLLHVVPTALACWRSLAVHALGFDELLVGRSCALVP